MSGPIWFAFVVLVMLVAISSVSRSWTTHDFQTTILSVLYNTSKVSPKSAVILHHEDNPTTKAEKISNFDELKLEMAKLRQQTVANTKEIERLSNATSMIFESSSLIKDVTKSASQTLFHASPTMAQNISEKDRKVYFLPLSQINRNDGYSASWLQTVDDFLTMDFEMIQILEDSAFSAFYGDRLRKLSMTLDWLDFSVEHLSKWWKMLRIFEQNEVYKTAMQRFDNYMTNAPMQKNELSFQETVAVIAFYPIKNDNINEFDDKSRNLTVKSLGITMESLRRAGFGRVVVVGENQDINMPLIQETFRYLVQHLDPNNSDTDTIITKVGHMQVGYANYDPSHAKTEYVENNIPRATLFGLKRALLIRQKSPDKRTKEEMEYIKIWLGEEYDIYKYVYLTEPDSILQTRPSTLRQLKERVDEGMVLVPRRLQPIPHEMDVGDCKDDYLFLPGNEFEVIDLDSIGEGDACCDAHLGPKYKPGKTNVESCGNFWYICDFRESRIKGERTYKRIRQYSLMRLKQGTGIVSLAGSVQGRPCIPQKNSVCLPPKA